VRVGEPEALPRQPIDVRRPDPRRPVAPDVAVPQVVDIDEDDVRRLGGGLRDKSVRPPKRDRAAEKQAGWSVIRVVPGDPERRRRDGASSLHLIMGRLVDPSKVPHLIVGPGDEPRLFSILLGRRAGLRGSGGQRSHGLTPSARSSRCRTGGVVNLQTVFPSGGKGHKIRLAREKGGTTP